MSWQLLPLLSPAIAASALSVCVCVCVYVISQSASLTSISVIKINKLLPLVMGQQTQNGSPQTGPHLDDKLHVGVDGEAGGDEGGVQRSTEGGQRVHGLPVVEAEDGVDPS